ncbi:hypothetical protein K438DRAFT_396951 [Mycena galopus ATCC 62051]|nr:hypothetical protein K438DRAFT_396951 [Mycena galopus ATCC 62051]
MKQLGPKSSFFVTIPDIQRTESKKSRLRHPYLRLDRRTGILAYVMAYLCIILALSRRACTTTTTCGGSSSMLARTLPLPPGTSTASALPPGPVLLDSVACERLVCSSPHLSIGHSSGIHRDPAMAPGLIDRCGFGRALPRWTAFKGQAELGRHAVLAQLYLSWRADVPIKSRHIKYCFPSEQVELFPQAKKKSSLHYDSTSAPKRDWKPPAGVMQYSFRPSRTPRATNVAPLRRKVAGRLDGSTFPGTPVSWKDPFQSGLQLPTAIALFSLRTNVFLFMLIKGH